ncbi:MAG: enoyl-CoA hydratase/isomerase family protein [Flavobacteriales bacterium]|jgi:methylglutaconyl-CoA hydratase|nr:enoyl-CoA hydratase/isomerase family protein [Flavobacteriales bacterium]
MEDNKENVSIIIDKNGIGTIEFYHPQSNSLPGEILSKIAKTINQASLNKEIKVIVLKSAGNRAFCAGASFEELIEIKNIKSGINFFLGFANVINACRKCTKIIIGRVQGKAVGGGVGLASAVDYCFATRHASIKLSELALGIGPFVVGPAVERKIGLSSMSALAINADKWFDANWGLQKGLYSEIFQDNESMDKAIDELSFKLSQSHQEATKKLKKIFWKGTENWDELLSKRAKISGELILSEFSKNAIKKIQNK